MVPTLLYYPLVRPPVGVLHHALLYWDDIASLVPGDSDVYQYSTSRELEDLKDRGLYHPLNALSYQGQSEEDHFTTLLQAIREAAVRQSGGLMVDRMVPIFSYKLQQAIEGHIVQLGLGRRVSAPRRSIVVSERVQHLVMGSLAHAAANTKERAYVLHTDQQLVQESFLRPSPDGDSVGAWRVELGRLFPTPAPGTSTDDVLAFRARYADERERLIGATQLLLNDLRRNWDHPADIMQRMRVEITRAREDYEAAAKSARMAWVNRGTSVVIATAAAAAGALVVPDLGWVAGIAGSIGSISPHAKSGPRRPPASRTPSAISIT
ncbi:hypothetical protein [Streptomyces erythrochromogenes]|uniref:hypothetical protein n=1 Tax=Streptomyces erythrochromogenes TaxID=285574 RepID=UPI0033D498A6